MIRIREIVDPDLKRQITEKLAERRGLSPAAIPEWSELDDADFGELVKDVKEGDEDFDGVGDPRM